MSSKSNNTEAERVLVIGGGFLGRWVIEKFLDHGCTVHVFDIRKPFDDDRVAGFHAGDLRKPEDVRNVIVANKITTVVHTASPPYDAPTEVLKSVNVEGTRVVLEESKRNGVRRFVWTSSGSVVANGVDIVQGDETLPYASTVLDGYAYAKALGEQVVLKANDPANGFYTCALRVSGLFGVRDPHFVYKLVEVGRGGKSKFSMTHALFDFTYIENAADSHVDAFEALKARPEQVGGQAFFITNDEPQPVFDFFSHFWRRLGYQTPRIKLPITLMLYVAWILELILGLLAPIKKIETTFTYFRMWTLAYHRIYNIDKAKRLLNYKPKISLIDGVEKTVSWIKKERPEWLANAPQQSTQNKKQH